MILIRFLPVLFFLFPVLGQADAGQLVPGGRATVTTVVDGDTVLLDTAIDGSREVRLVGIQAPKLPLGRKGFRKWPLADDAKAMLEALVLGRVVNLKFGGRRMDRHGRLLAHLYHEDGQWVQGALLAAGMARVYSFPDNRAAVADMLSLEAEARSRGRGIWRYSFYKVRTPDTLDKLIGTFQLIEGRVVDAATVRGTTYLNFSTDWRSDFTITVKKKVRALFEQTGHAPLTLKGHLIRVRGWLKKRNGPMIEATHPEQIEILSQ